MDTTESESGTDPEEIVLSDSDTDEEIDEDTTFDDNLNDGNNIISQSTLPPSPAPVQVASDSEFRTLKLVLNGSQALFASDSDTVHHASDATSTTMTTPLFGPADPSSEPSTSSPQECATPRIELPLDSGSWVQRV